MKKEDLMILSEDYRLLICGKSNTGKTNVVIHMIRHPLVIYDKIYIYTPNRHQDKFRELEKLMDDISKKWDIRY